MIEVKYEMIFSLSCLFMQNSINEHTRNSFYIKLSYMLFEIGITFLLNVSPQQAPGSCLGSCFRRQ